MTKSKGDIYVVVVGGGDVVFVGGGGDVVQVFFGSVNFIIVIYFVFNFIVQYPFSPLSPNNKKTPYSLTPQNPFPHTH